MCCGWMRGGSGGVEGRRGAERRFGRVVIRKLFRLEEMYTGVAAVEKWCLGMGGGLRMMRQ